MQVYEGTLRRRVDAGDVLVMGMVHESRSPVVVEMFHETGYDVMVIDREHTCLTEETIAEQLRLSRALGLPCMVRVVEDCYHELNRTLDQAPDGIFIPRLRSREQGERIMDLVHYPPLGHRGLAGSTCPTGRYVGWPSLPEQVETINRQLVVGIQIETAEALADLDGILSVPGVDIAVVGNDDLSISMGIHGQFTSPEYLAAVESVIAACRRHGVLPGIAAGGANALYWLGRGMRAFWYASDLVMMWQGCQQAMDQFRAGQSAAEKGTHDA